MTAKKDQPNRKLGTDGKSFILELIIPSLGIDRSQICIEGETLRNGQLLRVTPWFLTEKDGYDDGARECCASWTPGSPVKNPEAWFFKSLRAKYSYIASIVSMLEEQLKTDKKQNDKSKREELNQDYQVQLRYKGIELTADVSGTKILNSPTLRKVMEWVQEEFECYIVTNQFNQPEIKFPHPSKENTIIFKARTLS